MSGIKIEKNIPPPFGGGRTKYPFSEMQVGDSFFIPCSDAAMRQTVNNLIVSAKGWSSRNNNSAKFTARAVEGGARVWRLQ